MALMNKAQSAGLDAEAVVLTVFIVDNPQMFLEFSYAQDDGYRYQFGPIFQEQIRQDARNYHRQLQET